MSAERGWYCIRCAPKREYALELRLIRANMECLVPREIYWTRATKADRLKYPGAKIAPRDRPIFTRTVFVNVKRPQDWHRLRMMPFVDGALALRLNGKYYRLSESDVSILHRMNGTVQPKPKEPRKARPGDKAKIAIGAFAGHECEVQSVSGKRAHVLMMLLGSLKTVELPLTALEAA